MDWLGQPAQRATAACELVAEFDAVEQGGSSREKADVAQVQVTVTATYEPLSASCHQAVRLLFERVVRPGGELAAGAGVEYTGAILVEPVRIPVNAPLFAEVIYQATANHTVSGVRVRWKMVPAVTDTRRRQPSHQNRPSPIRQLRQLREMSQRGHTKPSGHRSHSR